MKSQVDRANSENKENDFLDAVKSTMVTTAIFMGIFIIATVISLLK
ncbi:YqzM family protein [Lihuaxuella thermophila]|nr:YqzM family protein [Lihuaxuella thermophila]